MSGKSSKSKAKDKDKAVDQAKSESQVQVQETPESISTEAVPEPQEESITTTPEETPAPESSTAPDYESDSTLEETSTPTPMPAPTIEQLYQEVLTLKQLVIEHFGMIIELQQTTARKRKPVASNGKVQIRDKQTGKVYPSKNNVYQSLLKAGELKELVAKGVFGNDPAHNTFGIYTLMREWPDRFEEVKEAQNTQ